MTEITPIIYGAACCAVGLLFGFLCAEGREEYRERKRKQHELRGVEQFQRARDALKR